MFYKLFTSILFSTVSVLAVAQNFTVSGSIIDDTGETVPGATVMVKRAGKAVVTDLDGNYVLSGISPKDTLEIQHLSYVSKKIFINGKIVHNVTLHSNVEELEEAVAIGYGTVKKSDLSSAISVVNENDIQKSPVISVEEALQGNATGLVVTTTGSEPGADVSISVRGASSISGDTEPLIVIDNILSDNAEMTALNPEDIKSMEVLKDAAATAMYGSRGSNGVIMITTKSGSVAKPSFSISARIGLQFPGHLVEVMDGPQFTEYDNLSRMAWGYSSVRSWRPDTMSTTNYSDMLIQKMALRQEYNASLKGGTKSVRYNISAGFLDQQGILVNSGTQKFNLRGKINLTLTPKLNFELITAVSNNNIRRVSRSTNAATIRMLMMSPLTKYADGIESQGDGTYIGEDGELHSFNSEAALAMNSNNLTKNFNTKISGHLEWQICKSLSFHCTGSYSYTSKNNYGYVPRKIIFSAKSLYQNAATRATSKSVSWTNENYFNWQPTLNKRNVLRVMFGQSWSGTDTEGFGISVNTFDTDYFKWDKLNAANVFSSPSTEHIQYNHLSFFGRVIYTYGKRYSITALVRADGSSRFGENKKFGCFPAVSFAWNMKNEKWLKSAKWLNELKPRISFGITGNDRIGVCQSMSLLTTSRFPVGEEVFSTIRTSTIGNENLQWETTAETNFGIDFSAFKDRLRISTELYYKQTQNLLYSYRTPMTTGYSSVMANVGNVENKGVEVEVTGRIISKKNFYWTSSFNCSYNKNKVLDLGGNDNVLMYYLGSNVDVNVTYLKIGQPVGVIMGYETDVYKDWNDVYSSASVWNESASTLPTCPGMLKYKDQNNDGVIDENDRVPLGNTLPTFVGGFTNTFGYKGITLTLFFTWATGNQICNMNCSKLMSFAGNYYNQYNAVSDTYRPTNPIVGDPGYSGAQYPLPSCYSSSNSTSRTYSRNLIDKWVFDGSYLRLKTVSLAYDLPTKAVKAMRMKGMQIALTGSNLWVWTKYVGYDPEMSSSLGTSRSKIGIDYGSYPSTRTVLLKLGITF